MEATRRMSFNLLDMSLENTVFGNVKVLIHVDHLSIVDSFIDSGTKEDGTELSETELDILSRTYDSEIQEFCYSNGSLNHK